MATRMQKDLKNFGTIQLPSSLTVTKTKPSTPIIPLPKNRITIKTPLKINQSLEIKCSPSELRRFDELIEASKTQIKIRTSMEKKPPTTYIQSNDEPKCIRCGESIQNLHKLLKSLSFIHQRFVCIKCSKKFERKTEIESDDSDQAPQEYNNDSDHAPHKFNDSNSEDSASPVKRTRTLKLLKVEALPLDTFDDEKSNVNNDILNQCDICKEKFKSARSYVRHVRRAHPKKMNCRVCLEECDSIAKRMQHERENHFNEERQRFECSICKRTFKLILTIEAHMGEHKDADCREFICDICGRAMSCKSQLARHLQRHEYATKLRYFCDSCPKGFRMKCQLTIHAKRHTDQRPYVCEVCSKSYKDSTDLRRHKWTHGGFEKNYKCHLCDKAFYENKLLRYHLKTHIRLNEM